MADFAFAIVVPLALPIQTVATLIHDTELHVTTANLIGAGGVQNFKMVPVEPEVNSSVEEYAPPWSGACHPQYREPASISRHPCRNATNDLCRCTIHPTLGAGFLRSRIALH